jgi:hypothetical protein
MDAASSDSALVDDGSDGDWAEESSFPIIGPPLRLDAARH